MPLFLIKTSITRWGPRGLLHSGDCGPQLGFALLQLFRQLGILLYESLRTRGSLNQLCQLFQVPGATNIHTYQIFLPVYLWYTGSSLGQARLEQLGRMRLPN